LFCGAAGSLGVSGFDAFAPKPLKMPLEAGVAGWAELPMLPKRPLGAGVLAVF
jgi:hypothetical protein